MTTDAVWPRLLELGAAMLALAKAGDFEAVERLDGERRALLEACETAAGATDCPAATRETLLRTQAEIEASLDAQLAARLRHDANVRRLSGSLGNAAFSQ